MNQQLCDPNRLASFVRGELSDDAERELTSHLDECESCGQALEQRVAEAAAWREASVFLGDRSLPDQEADFSVTQSRDAQIEHVVSQLSPTDDPGSLGRIGGYEVTGVVGSGGMGVVLKAHDHSLDRVVAVKVMAPHLAASGSARQRFAREAKAAAAVLHPNVIAIHGVSNEQALPYLVMPYVRGHSLQKRIDAEGSLPLVDILRIGAQVAAGLAAAHEQGLVHRDIKPGNILMEQGVERVTITDFGLARAVDDASMTRSGVIAGTPQYMSPEQARAEKIDHRSDLFSLGSVLYATCTGHPPFRAESSFSVLRLITDKQPRPIRQTNPEIPDWLCAIIQKLMAKDADDRFASAQEVAELLEKCVAHVQQPLEFELPMAPEVQTSGVVTTDLSQWANCVFSNPQHQRSFFGRHVWPFLERGKVRLTNDSIEWMYNSGLHQTIPFSCIEEVAIGRYSRLTHPMRMDYLSIRYRDGDSIHTQLLTPLASWLTPVSTANAAVRRYSDRLPQPTAESEAKSSRRGGSYKFLAACLLPLCLLAGVLIVLRWNTGTLRIESEVDDVPIRIVQGKEVVEELTVSKSGDSVRIAAGTYEVEIGGLIDGIAVDDGSVTLQRGGSDIVRIVKVAPVKSALGDWPYGRLLKDLQAIKPPGGVPVTPSGAPISVAMGNELTRRLEAVPDGELDRWVDQLERVTGDKLDDEMARQACRTYIVNRMSVLFDGGDWNLKTASRLFKQLQSLTPAEVEAWKNAFEALMKETIGQNDREVFDGGPSYAVPLVLISVDQLFDDEIDELSSGTTDLSLASGLPPVSIVQNLAVKYRKRLSQLAKQDIASWRSKVDRFGGTKLDAAMNIILLDDYFVDETFQDGDFSATLGGPNPKRTAEESTAIVTQKSAGPQTRLDFEARPQDVIALQIGPTKHNKSLEWTSVAAEMGPFSATITDEKVRLDDGSWGPGFTFTTQGADGRASTSYIAMAEGGPLPIGRFYLYGYQPNTLLDLKASVKVGEIKYSDGTSAPVSVTSRAANDTMVVLPVRVGSTSRTDDQTANQSPISPRRGTIKNLTRIVNALHRYHELHGHFPPATILGKYGKGGPPHSWRVELLPLLGYGGLYDRYNFKAAWDSQRNLAVLAQMPDVYRSPLDQGNSTDTSYFGVVSDDISKRAAQLQAMREQRDGGANDLDESAYIGDEDPATLQAHYEQYTPEATVFWKQRGASFRDMLDGTSNCIAVIEAKRDVPWTKPEDIDYSADQQLPKFGGWFEQGVHAAFADGTVKYLANYNDDQTIRNLLTISDGQPVKPLVVRRLRIHGAVAVSEEEPEAAAVPEIYRVPDGPLLRVLPDQHSIITEADIAEVAATIDPNSPSVGDIVAMTLTEEAGKRFLEATSQLSEQNVDGYMLITLDRKVLIAPRVLSPIANKLTITGDIDAKALAEEIQAAMKDLEPGESPPPVMVEETLAPAKEVSQPNETSRRIDARSVVETYVAAALTGDVAKAAAMATGSPADPKQIKEIPDTPTIEEATRQFNLQSAADRRNLFDPPIGELSVQQMRDAFTKTASEYREIGEHAIADSLQNIAATGKLPSDALSPVYASGPYGKDEDGKLTQKQIAPMLVLPDGRGGARLVPLRSAELIYNKNGRSSKRYGDVFEESARFDTRVTGQFGFLNAKQSVSLVDAVAAFNRMARQSEVGRKQQELTADEVVASLRNWIDQNKGNAGTRKELQEIIDTQTFQPGHQLSYTSRYISEGNVFDVWEIRFGDKDSVPWLKIRDVLLASRPKTPHEQELWEQIRAEMAKSFDHARLGGLGASGTRSPQEQSRLGQLLDQAYQPPANGPGAQSPTVEADLHKFRPSRATRRAQVEARIHQTLQQPTLKSIKKSSLDDIVRQFANFHDVKIIFDPVWLEHASPDRDQPFTVDLGDLTLEAALDFILEPQGMSYFVRQDEIRITSLEIAARYQYERFYELPLPLEGKGAEIIEALTTKISPDKWWLSGGDYVASENDGWLTISANRSVHEAASTLLEELQKPQEQQPTTEVE